MRCVDRFGRRYQRVECVHTGSSEPCPGIVRYLSRAGQSGPCTSIELHDDTKTTETRPMTALPAFRSLRDYVSRIGNVDFWRPYVEEILGRHGLTCRGQELEAGFNPTYPTFIYSDLVLKLFGYFPSWRESHRIERRAHALIATDPKIAAPRMLAEGNLFEEAEAPWPYLITERVSGVPWMRAGLSTAQQISVARDVGRLIKRVHRLRPRHIPESRAWQASDIAAAARHSSLPSHLIGQIGGFWARLGPFDRVFVHGDLVSNHLYVRKGRLVGIIDWGDATITDRHYELAKLHFGAFSGNRDLLRAFLETSEWPIANDFAIKSLGLALCRQASGISQHHTFDVFHALPSLKRLDGIGTLEDLAVELFAF